MLSGTRVPAANLTAEKPVRPDFLVGIPDSHSETERTKVNSDGRETSLFV